MKLLASLMLTVFALSGFAKESADLSTQEVWDHHIQAWVDRDLEAIASDYGDNSIMIINNKMYRGREEVKQVFRRLFEIFDRGSNRIDPAVLDGRLIYIIWYFTPTGDKEYFGTDTFTVEGGKIIFQTIASPLYDSYPIPGGTTDGNCRSSIRCSDAAKLWTHRAYLGYYGRCAECGGFRYWCERLDTEGGGVDLSPITTAFGTSWEYTHRFGGMGDAELIHNLYRKLFDRDADPHGLAFHLALMKTRRSAYNGSDQDATKHALSHVALDILLGAQGDDVDTLNAKLGACPQY